MSKGNHVFNAFDKVVQASYKGLLGMFGFGREIDTVTGSGGDMVKAEATLKANFGYSYQLYKEIMQHEKIEEIHDTQDDRPVSANDANSTEFGEASKQFSDVVTKWALTDYRDDPMDAWRQLVNAGHDQSAEADYIQHGSSAQGTPANPAARRTHCVDLSKFVKGELTRLVSRWMIALRVDLKDRGEKVAYDPPDKKDWKKIVKGAPRHAA
jgi:hypothetical protein